MLTIPFGHSIDALALVLANSPRLPRPPQFVAPLVTNPATGESAVMSAADQVAVTGVLEGAPSPPSTTAEARLVARTSTGRSTEPTATSSLPLRAVTCRRHLSL
ncbi:hypothetical protein [Nocardia rhamnosiphila]